MIYHPSMSDIDEPEAVMRRRAENKLLGPIPTVKEADPELERLLDEEERYARGDRVPGWSEEHDILSFTKHFLHNGREADFEVSTTTRGVVIRVKTLEMTPHTQYYEVRYEDDLGTEREKPYSVEIVEERIPMGRMVEFKMSFEEWDAFVTMMRLMLREGNR